MTLCPLSDGRRCVRYRCNTLNVAQDVLYRRPGWVEAKEWVESPCSRNCFCCFWAMKATCSVCCSGTRTGTSFGVIWPGSGTIRITCTWTNTWESIIFGISMRWGSLLGFGAVTIQIWGSISHFLCLCDSYFSSAVKTSWWKTSKDTVKTWKRTLAPWRHPNVTFSPAPSSFPTNITSAWRKSREPLAARGSWNQSDEIMKLDFKPEHRRHSVGLFISGREISREGHFPLQETEGDHGFQEGEDISSFGWCLNTYFCTIQ